MSDAEVFQFNDVFKGLSRVFPKRLQEHELQQMSGEYFRAMKHFTLTQVKAGADAWRQRGKFFPKPVEWMESIPRGREAVKLPMLSDEEARDYRRAESLRYEDRPCSCAACRAASVSDRPLRFVPTVNGDGTERQARIGDRTVIAGHWAHGQELARWYQAKADFYNAYYAAIRRTSMEKVTV